MSGNLRLAFILEAVDRATAPLQRVNARIDKLTEPVRRVRAAFGALLRESRMERVSAAWGDVASRAGGLVDWARGAAGALLGIGAAGTAAWFGIKRVADAVDQAADTAGKLGIAYGDYQRLGFAAQMNASSQEEAGEALRFLSRNMVEAINGSKVMVEWFGRVGLSTDRLRKMTALQVFEAIADRFNAVGDAGGNAEKKIALMMALMGRSGAGLKQVLDLGSAGLRQLYSEADELGVISDETAAQMGDFNDQVDKARFSLLALAAAAARGALPALNDLVQRTLRWSVANRDLIATRVEAFMDRVLPKLPRIAESLAQVLGALASVILAADRFAQVLGGWESVIAIVAGTIIGKGLVAVYGLTTALWGLGAAMMATPFGWVLAGVAALAAGAALVIRHWEPIKKFFVDLWASVGRFFDRFGTSTARPAAGAPSIYAGQEAWARYRAGQAMPTAGGAAQRAEVGGTLRIQIDGNGQPRVRELRKDAGGVLDFDVYAGATMPGW